MFNIGPMELMVLVIVGLVVIGPERLPGLARDAGRLLRALREVAQGARTQLRDELGPELADLDLRNLNPKTAIRRAVLGDDFDTGFSADDFRFSPKQFLKDAMAPDPAPDPDRVSDSDVPIDLTKAKPGGSAAAAAPRRPSPRPRPAAPESASPVYDPDTT